MLPEFYHKCISKLLTPRQYATLRIVVLILQSYRTIQIEKLAALLPIPIKYQSRRRHLQRFLVLPKLTNKCLWFPIIKKWLKINQNKKRICYLAIDRTRWQSRNLFMASLIKNKRAIPLNWMLLNKYVCRLKENERKNRRHSSFWVGLYGSLWVEAFQICHEWVEQLMILTPNKLPFYQQGIRARTLIVSSF